MQFLLRCLFKFGSFWERILLWCSWYLINFGNPGIKKPEKSTQGIGTFLFMVGQ